MVVELDPKALEKFLGAIPIQGPFGEIPLVERLQVLVQVTGVHGVPAVELRHGAQVNEPVHLQGFPEGPGRVGGHMAADFGDVQQFSAAGGIRFAPGRGRVRLLRQRRRHALGEVGVTLGEDDDRVARDIHRLELLALSRGVGIGEVVEPSQPLPNALLVIEHAHPVDLAVQRRVSGCPLLHELGENPRFVRVSPVLWHMAEHPIPHGPASPIRDDLLLVDVRGVRFNGVPGLLTGMQGLEVLHRVARQLWEGGYDLGPRSALADDELGLADVKRLPFAEILQRQCAQDRNGVLALVVPVESCDEFGPFRGDGRLGFETALPKPRDAFVHRQPPTVTDSP